RIARVPREDRIGIVGARLPENQPLRLDPLGRDHGRGRARGHTPFPFETMMSVGTLVGFSGHDTQTGLARSILPRGGIIAGATRAYAGGGPGYRPRHARV